MNNNSIHHTAIISTNSILGKNVSIGPYCIIEGDVIIGDNTKIDSHTIIKKYTTIGNNCEIFSHCVIGEIPQDKKYEGEKTNLSIGNNTVIREFCTLNRGTKESKITKIGNDCLLMAYVHVGHDCIIKNDIILANGVQLGGHVIIDDYVTLGGFTGVHQFCTLGKYCFSAISSVIVKDIPPFLIVSGNTAKPGGLNRVGLERHGMNKDRLNTLRKAYKIVYREGILLKDALEKLDTLAADSEDVALFLKFIKSSKRGIVR